MRKPNQAIQADAFGAADFNVGLTSETLSMNDVQQQIEHGLSDIDPDRTVKVNLRDLVYVYQTMQEIVSFFHQPEHYPDLSAVERFLGNRDAGAFHCISECVYEKMRGMMPPDIADKYGNGDFDSPVIPFYKSHDHTGQQGDREGRADARPSS